MKDVVFHLLYSRLTKSKTVCNRCKNALQTHWRSYFLPCVIGKFLKNHLLLTDDTCVISYDMLS